MPQRHFGQLRKDSLQAQFALMDLGFEAKSAGSTAVTVHGFSKRG